MALTKKRKLELATEYKQYIKDAKNIVIIKQSGIPVNEINNVRMDLHEKDWLYKVVKKRVLLKWLEETDLEAVELTTLDGSVAILCAFGDEYEPLKVLANHNKEYKKKKKEFGFDYIGWWFEGKRHDSGFVSELATLPSKEELIAKLLYMIQYPIQWLAASLDQIAQKWSDEMKVGDLVSAKK